MKRTIIIISAALISGLISFAPVAAQEKKSEQKIKIIIADGSGEKVVIDTVMNDRLASDTLFLKDGKMVLISHAGDEAMIKHAGSPENVFVTVTDNGKDNKEVVKGITIISSESGDSVISGGSSGAKVVIIKDGKTNESGEGNTYSYHMSSDKMQSDTEKTKYVISKDGMVITVEGSDYEKVKALVKEIESKLGSDKDKNSKKK